MTYSFDGFNYLIKLSKGESLVESLEQFVKETNLEGAWVNGLGGALAMTLGFYDLEKQQYRWNNYEGLFELAGLTGNIAFDEQGKPVFHLHGTFGDQNNQSLSGHIKDLTAAATVELFIHRAYQPTRRKHDPATGLTMLDLQS